MNKLKNLWIVTVVSGITLSSCYKEGPKISFRAKRDRLANEWIVTEYKVGDNVSDSRKSEFYVGDSIALVFNIARAGYYGMDMQFTQEYSDKNDGRLLNLSSNMYTKHYIELKGELVKNVPFYNAVGNGGRWSFDDKFRKMVMGDLGNRDLSNTDDSQLTFADILMLKNKMLKLKLQINGEDHTITFEPLNDETVK